MRRLARIVGEILLWLVLACTINVAAACQPVPTLVIIIGLLALMLLVEIRNTARK